MSLRSRMRYMNPYDIHKALINEYILKYPGDTKLLQRDTSKDRTDSDVLRENHKFLWDDETTPDTWELQFAKKYYDKLFKEYCIADLTFYKENKIALRWRIQQEVEIGKGQFICGNKRCPDKNDLKTWEVNFAYREEGEKKNALVKIRLCPECSLKLNFRSKKREVKRLSKKSKHKHKKTKPRNKSTFRKDSSEPQTSSSDPKDESNSEPEEKKNDSDNESPWKNHKPVDVKSRDEEMEDYLQDLLL